jgi:hypothetical protein
LVTFKVEEDHASDYTNSLVFTCNKPNSRKNKMK